MNNSEKILKMLSGFIEAGILTSNDLKKEILTIRETQWVSSFERKFSKKNLN